jgi:nitronate monooxygenase
MSTMTPEELHSTLNLLLECERAGARLLSAWLDELPRSSPLYERLREVQGDEARNCAVLMHYVLEAEGTPSTRIGAFYLKGLGVREWRERLEFLNRGQAWVARRIAAALPRVEPARTRQALKEMHDSHLANIGRCERLVASLLSDHAVSAA